MKNSLERLNIKTRMFERYEFGEDNFYGQVLDGKPKFVDVDGDPVPYSKTLVRTGNEIFEMFSDSSSYEDASPVLTSKHKDDLFSSDNGYATKTNTTGVVYGDDKEDTICWDARLYQKLEGKKMRFLNKNMLNLIITIKSYEEFKRSESFMLGDYLVNHAVDVFDYYKSIPDYIVEASGLQKTWSDLVKIQHFTVSDEMERTEYSELGQFRFD